MGMNTYTTVPSRNPSTAGTAPKRRPIKPTPLIATAMKGKATRKSKGK
jgi:hypothetical protein